MITTLNKISQQEPCGQNKNTNRRWWKLLNYLDKTTPDDKPLTLLTILDSNGIDDAIWALRTLTGYDREIRLFACWCACQSLPIFEHHYPGDMRPRLAIESAALYAEGLEDAEAMAAARDAACDAAWAAACDAAWAAAWAAARDAVWAADWDAAGAAAWISAGAATWAVARAAAGVAQREEFIKLCNMGHGYMPAT